MQSGTHQADDKLCDRAARWFLKVVLYCHFLLVERTDWHAEVRTCSPAHCCRHQALAPRSAEYVSITGMHTLPAVTDIMQTREYAKFADRVLASHDRAYILHISPAMRETLAEMQACLNQQCGIASCRHPDMMARLIAEKFAAINQAQPKVLNGEEDPVAEVVALPASTTAAAAADHSQLSSKLYFVSLAHSTGDCQHCCTVTALPFASPAAFRQPDTLAAIRQL